MCDCVRLGPKEYWALRNSLMTEQPELLIDARSIKTAGKVYYDIMPFSRTQTLIILCDSAPTLTIMS